MNQPRHTAFDKRESGPAIMDFRLSGIDYKPQVFMVEIEKCLGTRNFRISGPAIRNPYVTRNFHFATQ